MKRFISTIAFAFTIILCVSAQKTPIKFGKIDMSDLQMEVYNLDTSAAAVVLCDYGHFDSKIFKFQRIIRIKILKKEGLDFHTPLI